MGGRQHSFFFNRCVSVLRRKKTPSLLESVSGSLDANRLKKKITKHVSSLSALCRFFSTPMRFVSSNLKFCFVYFFCTVNVLLLISVSHFAGNHDHKIRDVKNAVKAQTTGLHLRPKAALLLLPPPLLPLPTLNP